MCLILILILLFITEHLHKDYPQSLEGPLFLCKRQDQMVEVRIIQSHTGVQVTTSSLIKLFQRI